MLEKNDGEKASRLGEAAQCPACLHSYHSRGPVLSPFCNTAPSPGRIVAHDIVWISLKSIDYTFCLRNSDGTFDFDGEDHGVASYKRTALTISKSLFPTVDMSRVDRLLAAAASQLNQSVADVMQSLGADEASGNPTGTNVAMAT